MTTHVILRRLFETKNTNAIASRETLPIIMAGAGRAAVATLPRHAQFNKTSQRFAFAFDIVDPAPGKSFEFARAAAPLGIVVRPHERMIQDVIRARELGTEPVLLHIDDAAAMAETVGLVRGTDHPIAGAFIVKSPTDRLFAAFFIVLPGDDAGFERLSRLLSTIAKFQAPGGGSQVIGDGARSEHRVLEPTFRRWMAERIHANLPRVAARLPLEESSITLTEDGFTSTPLFVHEGKDFAEPRELASVIASRGEWRVRLGAPVSIAELTDDGLRLHRIRRRVLDRGLSTESTSTVLSQEERKREAEARAAAASEAAATEALSKALTRAERETVNLDALVLVTD